MPNVFSISILRETWADCNKHFKPKGSVFETLLKSFIDIQSSTSLNKSK
jgi:hypothetical protein